MRASSINAVAAAIVLLNLIPAAVYAGESALPKKHDDILGKPALKADAGDLKNTVVTAHLKEAVQKDKNVIWCNTFQLAWNELCGFFKEDVRLQNEPLMVPALNEKISTKADIDEAFYVALAGMAKDNIIEKIKKALEDTFKGQASPGLLAEPSSLNPSDIVAYAYLFKQLEFEKEFEKLPNSLTFAGRRVNAFGIEEAGQHELRKQVKVFDYVSQDDFVVELLSKSTGDRLILAKIRPGKTLRDTVKSALERADGEPEERMVDGDVLVVPKMDFDITRTFNEITGKALTNPRGLGYVIAKALQNIRFRFDEKGAILKSEALIVALGCAPVNRRPKTMVLDKPFLLVLVRKGRKVPYFAMWVANPELLLPVK